MTLHNDSKRDDYCTPDELYYRANAHWWFTFDADASEGNCLSVGDGSR